MPCCSTHVQFVISWSTWQSLQVHLYLYHSGLIYFLQFHFNYTQLTVAQYVCSVIYSRVLQVSLSLHSTYSAWRNLWDACPSYMHTHCLHHFHASSLFALQLPLYNFHFCALCKCCLLSKPPTSHLRSVHAVMLCHSFHLCSLPSPPKHTPRTHTCTCSTKLYLYRCPHVPIHTIAPTNEFWKQASPLSFLNGPRHAPWH